MVAILAIVIPLVFALGGSQAFLYYKVGRMEERILNAVNGNQCKTCPFNSEEKEGDIDELLGGG